MAIHLERQRTTARSSRPESKQGQRRPYVFWLTGLAIVATSGSTSDALPTHFRQEPRSVSEVTSHEQKSAEGVNLLVQRVSGSPQLPTDGSPIDVDVDVEEISVCSDDAEIASPRAVNDDDEIALEELVEQLDDADANTLAGFRRHFLGQLDADDFRYAAGVLEKRRDGTRLEGEPLESEARFVFSVLSNQAYQKNWTPDPRRASSAPGGNAEQAGAET